MEHLVKSYMMFLVEKANYIKYIKIFVQKKKKKRGGKINIEFKSSKKKKKKKEGESVNDKDCSDEIFQFMGARKKLNVFILEFDFILFPGRIRLKGLKIVVTKHSHTHVTSQSSEYLGQNDIC